MFDCLFFRPISNPPANVIVPILPIVFYRAADDDDVLVAKMLNDLNEKVGLISHSFMKSFGGETVIDKTFKW